MSPVLSSYKTRHFQVLIPAGRSPSTILYAGLSLHSTVCSSLRFLSFSDVILPLQYVQPLILSLPYWIRMMQCVHLACTNRHLGLK
jgi:hypothetical protein